ncbi:MAG: hypothetical protein SFY81_07635, partial [Verrucomicrobiota bacterium]|nr:hypothetical protein [Verrucomicrobiota bacterium]
MADLQQHANPAQLVMGAAVDPSLSSGLSITVIVSSSTEEKIAFSEQEKEPSISLAGTRHGIDTTFFHQPEPTRSSSRFVPPPPPSTPENAQQLLARQPGTRKRLKTRKGWEQGMLDLEIISKGRFEKSEPTIHRGEDLDVPTYIRRGISLN